MAKKHWLLVPLTNFTDMMLIISPAKKLDFKPCKIKEATSIRFKEEAAHLVKVMKKKTSQDLMALMDISKALADLNVSRYQAFDPAMPIAKCKQSLFAFNGDVYVGLKAADFSPADVKFAQNHLRILSGLYGLLRPLDLIQEYRLEMGCGLKVGKNKNLYQYWDSKITDLIVNDMVASKDKVLVNLASEEYFASVKIEKLKCKLIQVRFEENRANGYQVISFSAKKARGFMARYIIQNKLSKPDDLKSFDVDRYSFNAERSTKDLFTFVR